MPEPFLVDTNPTDDLMKTVRVSLDTIRGLLQGGTEGEELDNLEQLFLDQEAKLNAIHTVLEEFNYSMAHELCAPLRRISGFTQEIKQRYGEALDSEGVEILNRILESSQQMDDLIEALMLVSRLSHVDLQTEQVDLTALGQEIAEELKAKGGRRQVVVAVQPEVTARGDHFLLEIMLRQLFDHAWRSTEGWESVGLELGRRQTEGKSCYFLRTSGSGCQEDGSGRKETGIGLTVVRKIIERHGGVVWVESEKGKGTIFWFSLP